MHLLNDYEKYPGLMRVVGTRGDSNIWLSELWASKDAPDASLASEEIHSFILSVRYYIADVGDSVETTVNGGKGIPSVKLVHIDG